MGSTPINPVWGLIPLRLTFNLTSLLVIKHDNDFDIVNIQESQPRAMVVSFSTIWSCKWALNDKGERDFPVSSKSLKQSTAHRNEWCGSSKHQEERHVSTYKAQMMVQEHSSGLEKETRKNLKRRHKLGGTWIIDHPLGGALMVGAWTKEFKSKVPPMQSPRSCTWERGSRSRPAHGRLESYN